MANPAQVSVLLIERERRGARFGAAGRSGSVEVIGTLFRTVAAETPVPAATLSDQSKP
ncbi:MAG: hypothetical protein ACQEW8_10385 [Actinomycetota bacterium]